MRKAALIALLAPLGALAGPAGGAPAPLESVQAQVVHAFGDARARLALPLREAGEGRTGADLVLRTRTGPELLPGLARRAGQALQLELQRPVGEWTAFGGAGWRRSEEGFVASPRRWFAQLGATRALSAWLELGAMMDLRQSTDTPGLQREATAWAALDQGGWRCQLSLTRAGGPLADTALDLSLRARF